jgi:hypothetical protein
MKNMREFIPSPHAIKAQAAIDIAAPPASVAALYRAVEKWGETFPATIAKAQVIQTGDNWAQIEVSHRSAGRVPNTLIFLSDTEVGLEESKKRFDAKFLNKFEPAVGGGTHYVITAYISPKGIYRVLRPFLKAYVRRQALNQMKNYVLEPLKTAAEKARLEEPPQPHAE